jgi:predicted ArsR family transcriptional regulator
METSRDRILRTLQAVPEGLDADELGARVGLHPNTVRFHLGVLAREGRVESGPEARRRPGRPRILFRSTLAAADDRPQNYRLLASILTSLVASEADGAARAEAAGNAWGRYLVDRPPPLARVRDDRVAAQVEELLRDEGFEPERTDGEIRMHRCPFQELSERNGDVVCSLHRGLLNGALAELGSKRTVELRPFSEPGVCVARLG